MSHVQLGDKPGSTRVRRRGAALVVVLAVGALVPGGTSVADPAVAPGIVSTVAGNGTAVSAGDGGPATAAGLQAGGVEAMPDGSYLVIDGLARVRKVQANGVIVTVAGTGTTGATDTGVATTSQLKNPGAVAATTDGGFLIADTGNHRIRKVTAGGAITTVAGTGTAGFSGDGGPATAAQVDKPSGVSASADGGFLVSDTTNNRIRKVSAAGVITTVAGTGTGTFNTDGPVAVANIAPYSLDEAPDGSVLFAELTGSRVRRLAGGVVTTLAGDGTSGSTGDGGPANLARLSLPMDVVAIPGGGLYVADENNDRVRRIDAAGTITTVLGDGTKASSGNGGQATAAQVWSPQGVAVLPDGGLLVADGGGNVIRRIEGTEVPTLTPGPTVASRFATALVRGTADAGSTVSVFTTAGCTGVPVATGTSTAYAAGGIAVPLTPNATSVFRSRATALGFTSACSTSAATYVQDSIAPNGTIKKAKVRGRTVKLRLTSSEPGSTFICKVDKKKAKPCAAGKKLKKLTPGKHRIKVVAVDAAGNRDATAAKKKVVVRRG